MNRVLEQSKRTKMIEVTCKAADLIPIDALMNFQGKIKTISTENLERLKNRMLNVGINAPFFIWKTDIGDHYIIDGHQRLKALLELREKGYALPLLPVVYIEASDFDDAKEKLLGIASQYGEYNKSELEIFLEGLTIDHVRLVDFEIKLDDMIDDSYGSDIEITEDDVDGATADVLVEVQDHEVKCGAYRFIVPHKEYRSWLNGIKTQDGFEYDQVVSGIRTRMGFND